MLCIICTRKNIRNIIVTNCGHIFCLDCIARVMRSKTECPLCQVNVTNICEVENSLFDLTNLSTRKTGIEKLKYLKKIYFTLLQEFNQYAVEFFNNYKVNSCEILIIGLDDLVNFFFQIYSW